MIKQEDEILIRQCVQVRYTGRQPQTTVHWGFMPILHDFSPPSGACCVKKSPILAALMADNLL